MLYKIGKSIIKASAHLFFRHQVYGLEKIGPGKAIIACNHTSNLDPLLIAASWNEQLCFLAKKELFIFPPFAAILRRYAAPVLAENDFSSIKWAIKQIKSGKKLTIFPEGSRTDGPMIPFLGGMALMCKKTQSPIIPAYISGTLEAWPRTKNFPKLFGCKTALYIGDPIPYSALQGKQREEISEIVRNAIAALDPLR